MGGKGRDPPGGLVRQGFGTVLGEPVEIRQFLVQLPQGCKGHFLASGGVKVDRGGTAGASTFGLEFPLDDLHQSTGVGLGGKNHFSVSIGSRDDLSEQSTKESLIGFVILW